MELSLGEADHVMQAALEKPREMNIRISVAVCDAGGRLMAFNRMDNAIWGSVYGSQGKPSPRPVSAGPAGHSRSMRESRSSRA